MTANKPTGRITGNFPTCELSEAEQFLLSYGFHFRNGVVGESNLQIIFGFTVKPVFMFIHNVAGSRTFSYSYGGSFLWWRKDEIKNFF